MTTDTSTTAGPLIEIQREDEIALVKLNRADKRNAINDALLAELTACSRRRTNFVVYRQKVNVHWLQGVETTMDSAHLGALHQSWLVGFGGIELSSENMALVYHIEQKPFGFRYAVPIDDENISITGRSPIASTGIWPLSHMHAYEDPDSCPPLPPGPPEDNRGQDHEAMNQDTLPALRRCWARRTLPSCSAWGRSWIERRNASVPGTARLWR
ncbi:hypothetical protein [Paraburkholderia youngii]|uniref:hypothetical protein n=1 Tax=Paraburkholderia youngii TaxID=2782701 RepID=UPI003D2153D8